ncbi:MAG: hypothetical protein ACLRH0_07120 [Blautia wexlerae]
MEIEEVTYMDFVTLTILLQQYQLEAARLYLVHPNRYQRDCNNPAYAHGIIQYIHIGIVDGMVILCKEGLQIYGMRKGRASDHGIATIDGYYLVAVGSYFWILW